MDLLLTLISEYLSYSGLLLTLVNFSLKVDLLVTLIIYYLSYSGFIANLIYWISVLQWIYC